MRHIALAIFTSVVLMVAGAAAQSCPQITFLQSEGDELGPDTGVSTYFTGSKKIPLRTFTYIFTVSAGKVVHDRPNDFYMKIDAQGLAAGTRIDVQVTAKRGSCTSRASTWFAVTPQSPEGPAQGPAANCPILAVSAQSAVSTWDGVREI